MIRFAENYSLKNHNKFALDVRAKYYFEFTDVADLSVFLRSNNSVADEKIMIVGEGSNILFLKDFLLIDSILILIFTSVKISKTNYHDNTAYNIKLFTMWLSFISITISIVSIFFSFCNLIEYSLSFTIYISVSSTILALILTTVSEILNRLYKIEKKFKLVFIK